METINNEEISECVVIGVVPPEEVEKYLKEQEESKEEEESK